MNTPEGNDLTRLAVPATSPLSRPNPRRVRVQCRWRASVRAGRCESCGTFGVDPNADALEVRLRAKWWCLSKPVSFAQSSIDGSKAILTQQLPKDRLREAVPALLGELIEQVEPVVTELSSFLRARSGSPSGGR